MQLPSFLTQPPHVRMLTLSLCVKRTHSTLFPTTDVSLMLPAEVCCDLCLTLVLFVLQVCYSTCYTGVAIVAVKM